MSRNGTQKPTTLKEITAAGHGEGGENNGGLLRGALDDALDGMPGNREPLHAGLHDTHEAEAHFDGDVHADDDEFEWEPGQQLDAPAARPGYAQRWVRMSLLGTPDTKNRANAEHRGWKPRRVETVPEGERKRYPGIADSKIGDVITNGELVLCEMPEKRAEAMRAYFRNKSKGQTDALLADSIRESEKNSRGGFHPMQVTERKTRVTTRRPITQADR